MGLSRGLCTTFSRKGKMWISSAQDIVEVYAVLYRKFVLFARVSRSILDTISTKKPELCIISALDRCACLMHTRLDNLALT